MGPLPRGLSDAGAVASEFVIDGETSLDASLTSEFVYGGAFGFEQFYGRGLHSSTSQAQPEPFLTQNTP